MARICPVCGKREIGPRAAMCEPCGRKAVREYYYARGICPTCKRNELYGGERMCIECRAHYAELKRKRYYADPERTKEQAHAAYRRRYTRRKEAGICYRCGRRRVEGTHILCKTCRITMSNKERQGIPRSERVAWGLCYFCGEPLDREGRSCKKCAERCIKTLERNRPKGNENWRRANEVVFGKRENKNEEVSV